MSAMRVVPERLGQDLRHLATFTRPGEVRGAVSRLPWTPEDRAALVWLRNQMLELGLVPSIDPLGNLWGVWDVGAGKSLVIGSHRDSVPTGGAFDGALGVMAALEVVRTLRAAGHRLRHNLEVVAWNDEEGARFGTTLFGSRMYVGALTEDTVRDLGDPAGVRLRDAVERAGFDLGQMRPSGSLARVGAYIELHVEQGPILEREDQEIGVVAGIGAILQERVTLSGTRVHAAYSGGDRHDPILGAARALDAVRRLQDRRNHDRPHALLGITVGRVELTSSLVNVVPEGVTFTIDSRSPDPTEALGALTTLHEELEHAASAAGLTVEVTPLHDHTTLAGGGNRSEPIRFHPELQALIRGVSTDLGYRTVDIVSWAGHDAMAFAPRVPTAMIFVPSHKGLSHTPLEFTRDADAARGGNVLLHTVLALDAASSLPTMLQ